MGKGDKRTRRGKIYRGTFGKSRPKKTSAPAKQAQADRPRPKEAGSPRR
jgi:30S ribosomal protein S31